MAPSIKTNYMSSSLKPLDPEPGHVFRREYWRGYDTPSIKAYPIFMLPWMPQLKSDAPNGPETFWQAIKTLLASFLYGLFAIMIANIVFSGADTPLIQSLIHALVIAIGSYLVTYTWTTDNNNLPVMADPAVAVSYFFNARFGILAILLWSVLIFGGHAAAGGVAFALGFNTFVSANNVASGAVVGLAVAFGILNVFSWIFNDESEEDGEREPHNQARFTLSYALAIFLSTLVFTTSGLRFYNAGLYLGAAINAGGWNAGLPGSAPWAYWIFGQWLVYSVGAGLLYWLFVGFRSWAAGRGFFSRFGYGGAARDGPDKSQEPSDDAVRPYYAADYGDVDRRIAGAYSGSARLRQKRKPVVQF